MTLLESAMLIYFNRVYPNIDMQPSTPPAGPRTHIDYHMVWNGSAPVGISNELSAFAAGWSAACRTPVALVKDHIRWLEHTG